MKEFKLICILFFVILQSCSLKKPSNEEVIGNWSNADGSSIVFKKNGDFYGKDLSVYGFYYAFHKDEITNNFVGSGKWEITKQNGKWIVDLDFKENSIYKKNVSINSTLFISGEGFLSNKRPIHLYLQVGDPDLDERYEFYKQ